MHADFYKQQLHKFDLFAETLTTLGWNEVFIPRLKQYMELEDRKCHNIKLSEAERHYAMGVYKALYDVLNFSQVIEQEKEVAINYLQNEKIEVE